MIIYRKEPFNAQMLNLILLEDKTTGGVVYVNKEVFQQAVSLSVIYDNNHDRILDRVLVNKVGAYFMNKELMATIKYFSENAPEPLNILANYLIYTTNANVGWTGDMEQDMVKAYGFLHMFSNFIDFYRYTLATKDVRSDLDLASHVLNSYESSWDDLAGTLEDKVVLEKEVHIKEIITREYVGGAEVPYVPQPMPQMTVPVQQVPIQPVVPTPQAPVQPVAPIPIPQVQEPVAPIQPVVTQEPIPAPTAQEISSTPIINQEPTPPPVQEPKKEPAVDPSIAEYIPRQESVPEPPKPDIPQGENIVAVSEQEMENFKKRMEEKRKAKLAQLNNKFSQPEPKKEKKTEEDNIADETLAILDEYSF